VAELVGDAPLFKATADGLRGLGDDAVANLRAAIEASKGRPLANLLVGLNIRHLGPVGRAGAGPGVRRTSTPSAPHPPRPWRRSTAWARSSPSRCTAWFADPGTRRSSTAWWPPGINVTGPEASGAPQTLLGKAIVVTGTLEGYTRDEAEAAISDRGGTSPGSVSKKTTALVIGASPGSSKVTKAESLGIPVLDQAAFEHLLETGDLPGDLTDVPSGDAPGP
jgi:DNA ligase (NAD+)